MAFFPRTKRGLVRRGALTRFLLAQEVQEQHWAGQRHCTGGQHILFRGARYADRCWSVARSVAGRAKLHVCWTISITRKDLMRLIRLGVSAPQCKVNLQAS